MSTSKNARLTLHSREPMIRRIRGYFCSQASTGICRVYFSLSAWTGCAARNAAFLSFTLDGAGGSLAKVGESGDWWLRFANLSGVWRNCHGWRVTRLTKGTHKYSGC